MQLKFNIQLNSNFQQELEQNYALLDFLSSLILIYQFTRVSLIFEFPIKFPDAKHICVKITDMYLESNISNQRKSKNVQWCRMEEEQLVTSYTIFMSN